MAKKSYEVGPFKIPPKRASETVEDYGKRLYDINSDTINQRWSGSNILSKDPLKIVTTAIKSTAEITGLSPERSALRYFSSASMNRTAQQRAAVEAQDAIRGARLSRRLQDMIGRDKRGHFQSINWDAFYQDRDQTSEHVTVYRYGSRNSNIIVTVSYSPKYVSIFKENDFGQGEYYEETQFAEQHDRFFTFQEAKRELTRKENIMKKLVSYITYDKKGR